MSTGQLGEASENQETKGDGMNITASHVNNGNSLLFSCHELAVQDLSLAPLRTEFRLTTSPALCYVCFHSDVDFGLTTNPAYATSVSIQILISG